MPQKKQFGQVLRNPYVLLLVGWWVVAVLLATVTVPAVVSLIVVSGWAAYSAFVVASVPVGVKPAPKPRARRAPAKK